LGLVVRALLQPHGDVVRADADEQRPDADVGVRTSLSLIGFGFTIFQFFHTVGADYLADGSRPTRRGALAAALVALGVLLLVLGVFEHLRETAARRARRERLYRGRADQARRAGEAVQRA
jgi:hypothetical protein